MKPVGRKIHILRVKVLGSCRPPFLYQTLPWYVTGIATRGGEEGFRTPVEEHPLKNVILPVHLRTGAIHRITRMGERALGTGRRVEYKVCNHRPVHVPTIGVGLELDTTWWVS